MSTHTGDYPPVNINDFNLNPIKPPGCKLISSLISFLLPALFFYYNNSCCLLSLRILLSSSTFLSSSSSSRRSDSETAAILGTVQERWLLHYCSPGNNSCHLWGHRSGKMLKILSRLSAALLTYIGWRRNEMGKKKARIRSGKIRGDEDERICSNKDLNRYLQMKSMLRRSV